MALIVIDFELIGYTHNAYTHLHMHTYIHERHTRTHTHTHTKGPFVGLEFRRAAVAQNGVNNTIGQVWPFELFTIDSFD